MRELAYDIVYGTMEQGGHSDALFHRTLEKRRELSPPQKNYLKRLSYGTIERCIELDAILNQFATTPVQRMEPVVRTVLRMALYDIWYMEQVPEAAACNEAVELVKKKGGERYAGFVNGLLRNLLRQRDKIRPGKDWVRYSLPRPLMEQLSARYGKKTAEKIGAAFLSRSGETTLHIHTGRVGLEEYKERLTMAGISVRPGEYMEEALIVKGLPDVSSLPGYEEGLFFVQDESSMLPVCCAGIRPGQRVVDVCSAPGGKALHALMKLQGQGQVIARDVSEHKVQRIRENVSRMRFENAECRVWDARKEDKSLAGQADVVLADVPCSGIGIIGRKPEIKYRAMEQIEELVPLQRKICEASVKLLKPGGVFLYSTCTISERENEENVAWMEENCGLKRDSLNAFLPESLRNRMTEKGMLQMLPGLQKSDGFFVARMIRNEGNG